MGVMAYSLSWVMQDLYHQPYLGSRFACKIKRPTVLRFIHHYYYGVRTYCVVGFPIKVPLEGLHILGTQKAHTDKHFVGISLPYWASL